MEAPDARKLAEQWLTDHGYYYDAAITLAKYKTLRIGEVLAAYGSEMRTKALKEAVKHLEDMNSRPLTIEEWPPCGLIEGERRFDSGKISQAFNCAIRAIRALAGSENGK